MVLEEFLEPCITGGSGFEIPSLCLYAGPSSWLSLFSC